MTIDIGDEEQDEIRVFDGDNIHKLANDFGRKH